MQKIVMIIGKLLHMFQWTIPFLMLLGKKKDGSVERGLVHRVVMKLVSPLSNIGYRVYTNNYYSSATFFLDLKHNGFDTCGTIRKDKKGLSETLKSTSLAIGNNKNK